MFRGREVTHPERGIAILDRLAVELAELGVVEQRPIQEGRNMTMMMAPSKAVLAGTAGGEAAADEVFTEGETGDVAEKALESPLGQEAAAETSGDGQGAPDGEGGDGRGDEGAAEAARTEQTADAPADSAVS
jgi:translation initiation factor IF-3